MAAPALADFDGITHYDHRVFLHEVAWEDYQRLLEIRGDLVLVEGAHPALRAQGREVRTDCREQDASRH